MNKLLILGTGGHSKVLFDTAISTNMFSTYAFLDDSYLLNKSKKFRNFRVL